jgi:molybdopterin-biosynthesis enzyme MoeA-like protein
MSASFHPLILVRLLRTCAVVGNARFEDMRNDSWCADPLRKIAGDHSSVRIGSYPNTAAAHKQAFKVKLQLESRDERALQAAVADVMAAIPCMPRGAQQAG